MTYKFLNIYIFMFVLSSNFIMFAQGPGTGFEDENGETGGSVEDAPINGKLIWLAVTAVAFAFFYYRKKNTPTTGY